MIRPKTDIVVDTSVLIAVIAGEPERAELVERTRGTALIAPASVHWEIGNALAAMLKRRRATLDQALQAVAAYEQIPIRFVDVSLAEALRLSKAHEISAYDAYLLACAMRQRCALLTLDRALADAARAAGVDAMEVSS